MTATWSRGTQIVGLVCVGVLGLNVIAVLAAPPQGQAQQLIISVVSAMLIPAFWLGSARLIDIAARQMGAESAKENFLDASGRVYLILLIYAVLGLISTLANRWLPATASLFGTLVPLLALASIAWFVALTAVQVRRVYDLPGLNATAVAFLPYALVSAALLVFVLLVSLFQI